MKKNIPFLFNGKTISNPNVVEFYLNASREEQDQFFHTFVNSQRKQFIPQYHTYLENAIRRTINFVENNGDNSEVLNSLGFEDSAEFLNAYAEKLEKMRSDLEKTSNLNNDIFDFSGMVAYDKPDRVTHNKRGRQQQYQSRPYKKRRLDE